MISTRFVLALALSLAGGQGIAEILDAYVRRCLADWQVPGLAVAVVSGTLFSIGSTTKALTAATLGVLVEEQRLAWDDPVSEHLPGFRLHDPYATREVTVRDLLTHRAGLANADGLWYGSDRTRDEILARVPRIPPAYSLRTGFVYQNVPRLELGGLSFERASEQ